MLKLLCHVEIVGAMRLLLIPRMTRYAAGLLCCGLVLGGGAFNGLVGAALEPQGRLVQAQASAEQLLEEGVEQLRAGTAESLQTAILRFGAAAAQYRQDENQAGEALALLGLGRAHDRLGNRQAALLTNIGGGAGGIE
jgi:hypothetical protein